MQLKECASLELFSLSCIGFRMAIKDLNILSIHHTLYINLEVIQFICSFASLCESNLARQNVIVRLPLCNGLSFDLTFILRERLRSFDPRLYAAMRALRFVVLLAFVLARRVSRRQIGTLERPELEASGVPGSRTVQA